MRESVLRDLGNKYTGNEMDTISKNVGHHYYLRSLDEAQSYSGVQGSGQSRALLVYHHQEQTQSYSRVQGSSQSDASPVQLNVTTVCPYVIPMLRLPAPPIPKGNTAADYYEALDARDQEIRKGKSDTSVDWPRSSLSLSHQG